MIRRIGVALGAVAASLAFAASAQAAPSTPHLNPIPDYVCGSKPTVSWSKSTPDLFGTIVAYRLDIGDLTAGTATFKYVSGSTLSTQIGPLDLRPPLRRCACAPCSTASAPTASRAPRTTTSSPAACS